jgi:hypothetical protein
VAYTLTVEPHVTVEGNLGSHNIQETYRPAFEIEYDSTRITPTATLALSEPVSVGDDTQFANQMDVLGIGLSVRAWRWVGTLGALIALTVAAGVAAVAYLGFGRDEHARIQARYRGMLMPVESNGSNAFATSIHVGSMKDLARLAQRDGGIIFHELGPYVHRYFVRDGEDTYDYTVHVIRDTDDGEGHVAALRRPWDARN